MSVRRRPRAVVLALALVALLAGCAGLPTSGPVTAGEPIGEAADAPDFSFNPDPPPPDASPEQIVLGFLAAGSGPRENWGTARQYLSRDAREVWQPTARATIDFVADRTPTVLGDGRVSVSVTPEASVDATGALTLEDATPRSLEFGLVQEDGQWRISEAPDGVVLDRARFQAVFREYSVMYFDPTWTYLVPDRRWFPATNAATHITEALVDGQPTPWLAAAVVTAFPDNLELASRAVPVENGIAQVPLSRSVLGIGADTRDRMLTQLEASLQTAGILSAQMLVDDAPVEARGATVRSIAVDQRPLVVVDDGFGFLSGETLEPIPGLSPIVADLDPVAVQVDADRSEAAVRSASGAVLRAADDGSFVTLDQRSGLVDPTIDPFGYVWSVPEGAPSGLTAYDRAGVGIPFPDAWPGATQVTAIDVSRDGTRLAALVRDGTRPALWVAGILRDADGVPVGLGERETIATLPGVGRDIGWVDGATVSILAQDGEGESVITQSIGGFGEAVAAPAGAVSIAGANQQTAIRVLDADGTLFFRRGVTWPVIASQVRVLAEQQGAPR